MSNFLSNGFPAGPTQRIGELDLIAPDAAPLHCEMAARTEINAARPRRVSL